mgnify:FL=1
MRTFLALILLALIGYPGRVEAGAWAQPQGERYLKFSIISYDADKHFDGDGDKQALGTMDDSFHAEQGFLYAEYGALNRLTVIGQTSWGTLESDSSLLQRTTSGLGDIELGAKYQLTDGPIVLAPFISLKLPFAYDSDDDPALGTGDADLEFRLLASRSLYPVPAYIGAEFGYRLRGGQFSNQLPYAVEVGASPHARLFAKLYLSGINTLLSDGGFSQAMDSMSTQVSEGDFTKWGFAVAGNVTGPLWVDLLYESIFTGKNTGAGNSVGIGLSWH